MDTSAIAAEVDRLGPWITGFTAGGRDFGGQYFAEYDTRVRAFLDWLGPRRTGIRRLLECGCLEGGHTAALATALPDAQVIATEIRGENLARAALLARIRNLTNIRFLTDDLEEPAASLEQAYDAVVCIGLLYHLRDPAKFLARCARSSPDPLALDDLLRRNRGRFHGERLSRENLRRADGAPAQRGEDRVVLPLPWKPGGNGPGRRVPADRNHRSRNDQERERSGGNALRDASLRWPSPSLF